MSGKSLSSQSMARGFAVLSAASILVKILSLLFVPVIMKLMGGSGGYQVYTSANQIYAFVYVIATAGLPVAISKTVTEFISTGEPGSATRSFRLARTVLAATGLLLTVLLVLLARPIARASGYEEAWLGIAVIAPNILICSVLSAYRGYLQGLKNMTPTAVSQVLEQIVHLVVAIAAVLALRGRGLVWAVAGASFGTVAGSVAALAVVVFFYRKAPRPEAVAGRNSGVSRSTGEYLKLLARYSIPITLSSAIQYGGTIIDVFVVKSRLLSAGLSESEAAAVHGDLSAARQLINVPTALVTALCVSMLPVIAGLYAERKIKEAKRKADESFRLCFIVAVPCTIALMVYSFQIYRLLDFNNPLIMTAMAASVIFMGIVHLQSSIMQSVNLLYQSTVFVAVGVILKAVFNYVLIGIPSLNIYGAIISTYISYLVPLAMNALALRKLKGISIMLVKPLIKPVIAGALMLVPSFPIYYLLLRMLRFAGPYASNLIAFIVCAAVCVAVYFAVMRIIGGIRKEDVESISPGLARKLRL